MFADERDDEHRDRGGRRRDHPGPPAGEGNDDRDRDRGIEADARVNSGDKRKADRLGDQRERDDDAREDVGARGPRAGEPLLAVSGNSVEHEKLTSRHMAPAKDALRSAEHTSELQSLMRTSYA